MTVAILETYYTGFLDAFYRANPRLRQAGYDQQLERLLKEQFATADFYSKNLQTLGYQARDFIINNELLQKAWARERNVRYARGRFETIPKLREYFQSNWLEKILQAQVRLSNPDITYVQNVLPITPALLGRLKRSTQKLFVAQISYPINDTIDLTQYDLLITPNVPFITQFKKQGLPVEFLALGFEKSILNQLKQGSKQYNTVFIGGFSAHHRQGNELLGTVAKTTPIDCWGYGTENLEQNSPILDRYHGPAWGLEMFNILRQAKIAVNRHVDVAGRFAGNMRLYEATGVGTLLITDMKENLPELFEIGREVETYQSPEELVDKINYYLTHDMERQKIAAAGQARTLKDHTYQVRMKQLDTIFKKYLS